MIDNTVVLDETCEALEHEQRAGELCPSEIYQPHHTCHRGPRAGKPSGQLQFHQSNHPIRICAPGNGWGGTTTMAVELDWWARGSHPYLKTPRPPVTSVWFAPESRQFAMIWDDLCKRAWGPQVRLYESGFGGPRIYWPNGSVCHVTTYERGWAMSQGTQPDLAAFDEQPPVKTWREMLMRRRDKPGEPGRKCRYICKATQTEGISWMYDDIYIPWLKYHEARGLDEEQALVAQLHPDIWCWSRGGIHDNPSQSDETVREYESRVWPTEAERQVRLYGGFKSWSGHCVFDLAALERLKLRMEQCDKDYGSGKRGTLLCVKEAA